MEFFDIIGDDSIKYAKISDLVNKVITKVTGLCKWSGEIQFICDDGTVFIMTHLQDCCESVSVEEVNFSIPENTPFRIIKAEERTRIGENDYEHETYTFYDIQTDKGYLQIRWHGTSNGYYSESVDILRKDKQAFHNGFRKQNLQQQTQYVMLTTFDVIIIGYLFWSFYKRPDFEILYEYYMMTILEVTVAFAVMNGFLKVWFMSTRKFFLQFQII